MRKDDMASSKGRGGDITADELLLLLNKSIEEKPVKKKKRTDFSVSGGASLEIDDSVYESAKRELHDAEAVTATDDSDLDVDELIEKFINRPRAEAARAAAEVSEPEPAVEEIAIPEPEPAVEEITLPEPEPAVEEIVIPEPESAVEEITIPESVPAVEEIAIPETKSAAEPIAESDIEPVVSLLEQLAALPKAPLPRETEVPKFDQLTVDNILEAQDEQDAAVAALELPDVLAADDDDDSDMKVIPAPETNAVPDPSGLVPIDDVDTVDAEKTAVFDISMIREMTGSGEHIGEEGLAASFDTEVFTPVKEEDLAAAEEYFDAEDAPEETVFGNADSEDIDQTDLDLMVALGMNDELVDTVGEEQAVAIEDEIVQRHEETAQMQAVAARREFTSFNQIKEILTEYKSKYYMLLARIAAAVVLLGLVFVYENYSMLGLEMPSFARPSSFPIVYAMIDLQLIVLGGALVGRQLIDGLKSLVKMKPIPESMTSFALILSAVYTVTTALVAPVGGFRLFNMPVMLCVILALVYEFLNLKRDIFSFNVVASSSKKFVISPVSDETEVLEREAFEEFVPEESEIVRVNKTDFVDGFFERIDGPKAAKPSVGVVLPIVLALAVCFAILSAVKGGSAYDAVTMAFTAVTLTTPLTSLVIYSYPFYKASKDSYMNDSTIVGETSLTEYSNSAVISFEDREVFPPAGVKVTSIKVYGNNRIDEIIYKLASAFIKVGGPLSDVFKQATHDLGHSDDVELIEVDDDGFTVAIDGIQVYIGKDTYMEKKDYDPPYDHDGRRQEQEGSVGVLYVAYSGMLAAKVYVRYTIDGEFEKILSQLYKTGLCVGIKSFDPNIDDLLLAKKIKTSKYPVKVIRSKTVEDIPHSSERCNSGIVSNRSVKALLRTVALCERVGSVIKTNLIMKVLSVIIGVVVAGLVFAFGDSMTFSSLYTTLYQLFWAIPVVLISRFLI